MKTYRFLTTQKIVLATIVFLLICFIRTEQANAGETEVLSRDSVFEEYQAKKSAGISVFDLVDEDGGFVGYYEPYTETDHRLGIPTRYGASVNWTINAGSKSTGNNRYSLYSGISIVVNISQSRTGGSYLTFYNWDTNRYLRFTNTYVTNGWNGTIYLNGISNDTYSFGIENVSANRITYTGTYSL